MMVFRLRWMLLAVVTLWAGGCDFGPKRVAAPQWDPEKMSQKAIADADKDGNGQLSETELAALPGLAWSRTLIDTDGDKQLSQSEIQERLKLYQEMQTGLKSFSFGVTYRGQPLPNADVKLVPEAFVAEVIKPAAGKTDRFGVVNPAVAGQEQDPCMQLGFFRVEITSNDVKIAEKYNAKTTLGVEVAPVTDPTRTTMIVFEVGKK